MKTLINQTNRSTSYVVRAKGHDHEGREVEATYSMVRGMTDSGQPGWAVDGAPILFETLEEAQRVVDNNGWSRSAYRFALMVGSARVLKRHEMVARRVVEFETYK